MVKIKTINFCNVFFTMLFLRTCSSTDLEIKGAGGSIAASLFQGWGKQFLEYIKARSVDRDNVLLTYTPVGSGGGIDIIKGDRLDAHEYDFVSTEIAISDEEASAANAVQFPYLASPIVLAYNIPELDSDDILCLTFEQISLIFNGSISSWNDSRLVDTMIVNASFAKISNQEREMSQFQTEQISNCSNTFLKLTTVSQLIEVVVRNETSGSTKVLTQALSFHDSYWNNTYGVSSDWSIGEFPHFFRTNGILGIAGHLLTRPYSIGYMSLNDAKNFQLSYVAIKNSISQVAVASEINLARIMAKISLTNQNTWDLFD